jgi:hypothetical protein
MIFTLQLLQQLTMEAEKAEWNWEQKDWPIDAALPTDFMSYVF